MRLLTVEILPGLHASLVCAYDAPVDEFALRLRVHDPEWTLWCVRTGRIRVNQRINRQDHTLEAGPGQCLLLPDFNREHQIQPGTHLLSLRFHLSAEIDGPHLAAPGPIRVDRATALPLVEAAEGLHRSLPRCIERPEDRLRLTLDPNAALDQADSEILEFRTRLMHFFHQYIKSGFGSGWCWGRSDPPHPTLARACARLRERDPATGFSLDWLAGEVQTSRAHLRRLFNAHFGQSPLQWYDALRLQRVKRELLQHSTPIKTLAYENGFSSPAHFSHWFRKQTRMTPAAYRSPGARGV